MPSPVSTNGVGPPRDVARINPVTRTHQTGVRARGPPTASLRHNPMCRSTQVLDIPVSPVSQPHISLAQCSGATSMPYTHILLPRL